MNNPQTMQDLFQVSRIQWLEGARNVARNLLRRKQRITIEDVLELYPRPKYIHRNTTGGVFNDIAFHRVGYTKARKVSSNGRVIGLWTLSDQYAHYYEPDCEV